MQNNRLEILVDGVWERLVLDDNNVISYNKLVNRIGDINTREISHTNTFSLPNIYHNRQLLGLNVFNHLKLAKALNSKYECRYYVQEILIQKGFLIINQAKDDDIRVNFFDSSLNLIDNWARYTYRELLNDGGLPISADYRASIDQMINYIIPTTGGFEKLSENITRGHNLALYPNNLNPLGDIYMIGDDDKRPANSFNPYQSRPVFNLKSLFDLSCEAFQFTPIYDESVDWERIEKVYMVSSGLRENFTGEVELDVQTSVPADATTGNNVSISRYIAIGDTINATPNETVGWFDLEVGWSNNYLDNNIVFRPNLDSIGLAGTIIESTSPIQNAVCYALWSNIAGGNVVVQTIASQTLSDGGDFYRIQINKSSLSSTPAGGVNFLGVVFVFDSGSVPSNFQFFESDLPIDSVEYDDFSQLPAGAINLTYAAPDETLRELLINSMKVFGILMDIDDDAKTVLFYNYNRYDTLRDNQIFQDFSDYLLKHMPFNYNTDFGNNFARINKIGLNSPFKGNTRTINITNQNTESKLKDYTENYSQKFKDVEFVQRINNTITSANTYIEYTNTGLGLIVHDGYVPELNQIIFRESDLENGVSTFISRGTIENLPTLRELNMGISVIGIEQWYGIVDQAVKAEPSFLVPSHVMRNVDVTQPVYIEGLGGFYIIEEIEEYNNQQTMVRIKLIKLLKGAEFSDDFSDDFNT